MDYPLVIKIITEILRRKDPYNHHGSKVARICTNMVKHHPEHRDYSQNDLKMLAYAGCLHDLGKIFLPDSLLNNPRKLTDSEHDHMKSHVVQGFAYALALEFDPLISEAIYCHHENWNGSGYPLHLKGNAIPFFARLVRVADTYEAITSERIYQKADTHEHAMEILEAEAGSVFDEKAVTALRKSFEE